MIKVGSFFHKQNSAVELAAMRYQKHKAKEVSKEKKKAERDVDKENVSAYKK